MGHFTYGCVPDTDHLLHLPLQCTATVRQGEGRPEWRAVPGHRYFVLALQDIKVLMAKKSNWHPHPPDGGFLLLVALLGSLQKTKKIVR